MLTITRGNQTLTVTKGAYNSMYASQGWEITTRAETPKNGVSSDVFENKEITLPEAEDKNLVGKTDTFEVEKDTEDDEVDFSEIPLSQLSAPQLKQYAKQLGIEVNTDSARQLRNLIKKVLEG